MPIIANRGSPDSEIWVVVERPFANDRDKGYIYSSGLGYLWHKMLEEIGIDRYFVTCVYPDNENLFGARAIVETECAHWKPRIIIPLDTAGRHFCRELLPKKRGKNYNEEKDSEIFKYAGSILTCPGLSYEHYVVPTLAPDIVARQYKLKEQVQLDLAKAKSELDYFKKHGHLEPLPVRIHKTEFESFDEILFELDKMLEHEIISNDIETIYFKKASKSQFYGVHPGYALIFSLASSPTYSISLDLFRESLVETRELWRRLDRIFRNTITLGQNFYNFDSCFYESLGFRFREIRDTRIMHHVIWPELKHSLQYMTRQYTREPYYKDEGANWSNKDRKSWKIYNCKDTCVTFECYNEMLQELEERPWLK
jgi:uracil-DNA glycosylase